MTRAFRQRLLARERLHGMLVSVASAELSEVLGGRGFDWLFLDAEHGTFDAEAIRAHLRATPHCPTLVRIAALDRVAMAKALDAGAAGVIVPQIGSAAEALLAVQYGRYPPIGARGLGAARAQGYGLDGGGYLTGANDEIAIVVQAETVGALREIEAITRIPGLDGVLIGPYDLSAALGVPGNFTHPDFVAAVTHVAIACTAASMPLGVFGMQAAALRLYVDIGATLLVAGVDTVLLGHAAEATLAELRAL